MGIEGRLIDYSDTNRENCITRLETIILLNTHAVPLRLEFKETLLCRPLNIMAIADGVGYAAYWILKRPT